MSALLVVQPVVAQARTESRKPKAFRQDASFLMYAADVDGGFADFQGKPILMDGLGITLSRYGSRPVACATKKGATGCKPIVRFETPQTVVPSGSVTSWTGSVGNAGSGACSVRTAVLDDPVLALPDTLIPVSSDGSFWLMAGAFGEGVGTIGVQTNTGAFAENSLIVVD